MVVNKNINFNYSLNEAYSEGLQYAILDNEGNIRHKPIRCKDYIQDIYWSEILKTGEIEQYGFIWDGSNNNPVSKLYYVNVLLIAQNNDDLNDYIVSLKHNINLFEECLKFKFTEIFKTSNESKDIIIRYSNEWSEKPYLLSLYYLLLRLCLKIDTKNNIEELISFIETNLDNFDSSTIYSLKSIIKENKLRLIFINKEKYEQKWEEYNHSYDVHNYSGVVNLKIKKDG